MPEHQHILERRSDLLATALTRRVDAIVESLAPQGQQPAFTSTKSKQEALAWWRQHWDDDLGKQVRSRLDPESQLQLAVLLSSGSPGGSADGTGT